ncbi:hypothetical protein AB0C90_35230 [Streptomyces sp. NPDC048550]|uniref:hypothetical protein n=1 Tax=Streptomyces sp. NPDC048550 TaxID=3155739 RepID=UPI0034252EEA
MTGSATRPRPPGQPYDSSATGPRTYAGTRLTRASSVRYEHDAYGRVVLRQKQRLSRKPDTWRYEWDVEDRLVAVTTPDGTRRGLPARRARPAHREAAPVGERGGPSPRRSPSPGTGTPSSSR